MTHLCSVRVSSCTFILIISSQRRYLFYSLHSRCSWIIWFSRCHYFLRFVSYFSPRYTSYTLVLPLQPRALPMLFSYVSIHRYPYPSFVRILCVSSIFSSPNIPLMYRLWPTLILCSYLLSHYFTIIRHNYFSLHTRIFILNVLQFTSDSHFVSEFSLTAHLIFTRLSIKFSWFVYSYLSSSGYTLFLIALPARLVVFKLSWLPNSHFCSSGTSVYT